MANIEQLQRALVNADAAGDTEAARAFAGEIQRMRSSSQPTEQAAAPATPPDKYQAAARKEIDDLNAKGIDTGASVARQYLQGATFNSADEILAGLTTPLEMIRRGTFNPAEGYRYAKAREDTILEDARKKNGGLGTAAELGGGFATGSGLARAGLSAGAGLTAQSGLGARTAASALDGLGFGALAGGLEGNSLEERGKNALMGGAIGTALGGVAPGALSLFGTVASPITSNISARVNPERFARTQVARALSESGMTPGQVARSVSDAAAEGQGMFTLADAMGNPGQRMLATTARSPGQARTDVVNFLDSRQAGQGRRLANTLAEGFDSPQTAAQVEAGMTTARDTAADAAFGAARNNARPVDVSNVLARIDDTLTPGVNQIARPQSNIANDSIENALQSVRNRLTDGRSNLTDFTAIQRVRGDLADMANASFRAGQGNRARLLNGVLRELDTAMESASPGFRQANREFAQASRNIDAVGQGRTAALRGRTENTIPQFSGLTPEGQTGFRAGYVDPLIEQTQGAAFGVNKARPLTSDAFADEAAAMAPGNDLMQRRIGRENTMFQTRNAATGNSKTVENLNDDAAFSIDPGLVTNVLSGNWGGALRSILSSGSNALSGNTAQVRQGVADILLSRGQNVNPASIQRILDEAVNRIETLRQIASQLGRGGSGAVAVAPAAIGQR